MTGTNVGGTGVGSIEPCLASRPPSTIAETIARLSDGGTTSDVPITSALSRFTLVPPRVHRPLVVPRGIRRLNHLRAMRKETEMLLESADPFDPDEDEDEGEDDEDGGDAF